MATIKHFQNMVMLHIKLRRMKRQFQGSQINAWHREEDTLEHIQTKTHIKVRIHQNLCKTTTQK